MQKLTTQPMMAAMLARQTSLPIDRIVDITKRVHASASIIRDYTTDGAMPTRAASRARMMLEGTGWDFDPSYVEGPAIVRGSDRLVIV